MPDGVLHQVVDRRLEEGVGVDLDHLRGRDNDKTGRYEGLADPVNHRSERLPPGGVGPDLLIIPDERDEGQDRGDGPFRPVEPFPARARFRRAGESERAQKGRELVRDVAAGDAVQEFHPPQGFLPGVCRAPLLGHVDQDAPDAEKGLVHRHGGGGHQYREPGPVTSRGEKLGFAPLSAGADLSDRLPDLCPPFGIQPVDVGDTALHILPGPAERMVGP